MGADLYIGDEFEKVREVLFQLSAACGMATIVLESLLEDEARLPHNTPFISKKNLQDKTNIPFPKDVREWVESVVKEASSLQDFVNKGRSFFDYKDIDHFRDPYNATSVLWSVGLTWEKDCAPLADENCMLHGDVLKEFLKTIKASQQVMPTREDLEESHLIVDEEDNPLEEYHKDIEMRTEELKAFLRRAIDNELPVSCSL